MRVALISDIHSNLAAFQAVIADFGSIDEMWCLGDVVGYGPDPNECIERLRSFQPLCVAGNHDWGSVGKIPTSDFNADAEAACQWTASQLSPENRTYLEQLPTVLEQGDITLVHGSPRSPIWEYLFHPSDAAANFAHLRTPHCLVGHTHIPLIFRLSETPKGQPCQAFPPQAGLLLQLNEGRYIVNPGSVGQPRDGMPEASYALLDTASQTVSYRRVAYDIARTQRKMQLCGLPTMLWARLSYGW